MRNIGVVTTSRADYGIYLPVLRALEREPDIDIQLYVTGMHLAPEFGLTVKTIEADGFPIAERIEGLLAADTPGALAKSMGLTTLGFAQAFQKTCPDLLLVLGDRFEMFAAIAATLPFKIPVAHIHGGELTEGLIDDPIRHSITKMSHLHFPTTETYAHRIEQMGEEPWRISVCGAPGLDNLRNFVPTPPAEMATRFGLNLSRDFLLVTYHPVTLEYEQTEKQFDELVAALDARNESVIFTYPNADTHGRLLIEKINKLVAKNQKYQATVNLGTQGYFSLMSYARVMIGNSSSGIIEAASFKLPVVNIGNRQRGRAHGLNVLNVDCRRETILDGIEQALATEMAEALRTFQNPYDQGGAAEKIVARLKAVALGDGLILKKFHDLKEVWR